MKARFVATAAGGVMVAALTSACGGSGQDAAKTLTVAGTVVVYGGGSDTLNADAGDPCENREGYADINAAAQVVVKNSNGRQVGVGELGSGKVTSDNLGCQFSFRLNKVDQDASYSVAIGNRKPYSFVASKAGDLRLTLGG